VPESFPYHSLSLLLSICHGIDHIPYMTSVVTGCWNSRRSKKGGPVFKAHLVTQGFSQIPGMDFRHTFAPVAKSSSIHVLSAYAATNDWELNCFNAKRAFL